MAVGRLHGLLLPHIPQCQAEAQWQDLGIAQAFGRKLPKVMALAATEGDGRLGREERGGGDLGQPEGDGGVVGSELALDDDTDGSGASRLDLEGHVDDMAGAGEEVDVCLGLEEDDEGSREGGLSRGRRALGLGGTTVGLRGGAVVQLGLGPGAVCRGGEVGEEGLGDRLLGRVEPEALAEDAAAGPDDGVVGGEDLVLVLAAVLGADDDLPGVRRGGGVGGEDALLDGVSQSHGRVYAERGD